MSAMPGDNRARDAYGDWCAQMGGVDADGRVLRRWEQLNGQERAAWETVIENAGLAAARAADRVNQAAAGAPGWPPPAELR
jgi:hypothetical protein